MVWPQNAKNRTTNLKLNFENDEISLLTLNIASFIFQQFFIIFNTIYLNFNLFKNTN